jgi:hypothetical protein
MFVVALVAIGVWVLELSRLSREYSGKAQRLKSAEISSLQMADAMLGHAQDIEKTTDQWLATVTPMASARHPVAPDPPEPRALLEVLHNKDIPGLP